MKLHHLRSLSIFIGFLFLIVSCKEDDQMEGPKKLVAVPTPFATDLKAPIGITDDPKGNIWVTEAGTGKGNDGQVTVITPAGKTYPVITGFLSAISPENSPEGLNHLVYKEGTLYILHGVDDKLYVADVSKFIPGESKPVEASSLQGEDIGTFVRNAHPNAPDDKDSNPYNMTFGPGGDLFIVDAGANAIIRRENGTKKLSVYTVFPDVANPTYPDKPTGPPTIDAVPTGIVYDGTDFYVTTLVGFPFPADSSKIYQVSAAKVPVEQKVYKSGFSSLTDLAFSPGGDLIVTEFGFSAAGGRIASGEDAAQSLLAPAITPVDIMLSTVSQDTYYTLHYGPGQIMKLTAE